MKRKSNVAHVSGEIVDFKELTTEAGKLLAHLQIENADGRTHALIPEKVFRKSGELVRTAFASKMPLTIEGAIEKSESFTRLIADRISEI